ncbi:MAG: hypothetical protein ABEJ23_05330 [Haloarculaceae archaeon]
MTLPSKLGSWSQTLFLVGGVLLVAYGVLPGLQSVTSASYPIVGNLVSGTGGVVAFVGLLGLYARYVDRSPWPTRVGAAAAAVGAVGFAVVAVRALGVLGGVVAASPPGGEPGLVFGLILVGMILGFVAFSVADYRAGGAADRLTALLLAPAVVFVVIVGSGLGGITQMWVSAVLGLLHGLSYLAIGTALRTAVSPAERVAAADSAA